MSEMTNESARTPHRIDIEEAWGDFTCMKASVDLADADDFLALLYAWRDEAVTDALRTPPATTTTASEDR